MHGLLMQDSEFRRGGVDTRYFPRFLENHADALARQRDVA